MTRRSLFAALFGTALLAAAPAVPAASANSLKIIVYGGTGRIGSHIVSEALSRGHQLTVVSRSGRQDKVPAGVKVIEGEVLDSKAVAGQIKGQDVVISAVSGGGFTNTPETPQFQVKVAHSLIDALRSVTPRPRLVAVGGAGSLFVAPGKFYYETMAGLSPDSEMVTLKQALDYYRTVSDVDWTVLSPPLSRLSSEERTGKYSVGGDDALMDSQGKPREISVADLAVALVDEVERPRHIRKRFTVAY